MPVTTPNPQVPDPNTIPGYVGQQVPSPPQAEYPPQEAIQPAMQQSWGQVPGEAGMQAGFVQAGPVAYGAAVPARRRTSYMPAGILFGIGLMLVCLPFLTWAVLRAISSDFLNDNSALHPFAQLVIYALPIGIIVILISGIVAIMVAVMNSSSKS